MKLYCSTTSPFVRKVLVYARETGLRDRIELLPVTLTPVKAEPSLSPHNPLVKIPALVTDHGVTLYDSPVICEYLDTLHGGRKLTPASGSERFRVLRVQALCDGILDAGILVRYETVLRPKELQWRDWIAGQTEKVLQGVETLERESASFGADLSLAQICAGVTLGWLEFRKPVGDLRRRHASLFEWYASFRERPSMKATEPHT